MSGELWVGVGWESEGPKSWWSTETQTMTVTGIVHGGAKATEEASQLQFSPMVDKAINLISRDVKNMLEKVKKYAS